MVVETAHIFLNIIKVALKPNNFYNMVYSYIPFRRNNEAFFNSLCITV